MATTSLDGNVLGDLILIRMNRRQALRLGAIAGAAVGAGSILARTGLAGAQTPRDAPEPTLAGIAPSPASLDAETVAPGLVSELLIGWGDPVVEGAPAFDVNAQSAAAQALQFGFNCDYVSVLPYEDDYVLFVNHEYTTARDMFPGYPSPATATVAELAPFVDIELEAHGGSVVRITRDANRFSVVTDPVNRRITANTPMAISGPAASDPRVGTSVIGMLNQCAGGSTPWGTILTTEENFNQYFAYAGANPAYDTYQLPTGASERAWERVYPERFDLRVAPNEPLKFGYIVEIDPSDPTFVPVKRTSMGRTKHECANTAVAADGRVAVYSGDDQKGQYTYKFVTAEAYDPENRPAALELLDAGRLYVARLEADGSGTWLPLVFDDDPAAWAARGFTGQADICIRTRVAAAAVGATAMDRPEDVEVSPATGSVYIALTEWPERTTPEPGAPRANNQYGHIIELVEDSADAGATTFAWNVFLLCGDGTDLTNRVADPNTATTENTFFGGYPDVTTIITRPDNLAFDQAGNLFIGTDGQPGERFRHNDGVFYVPTAGAYRGRLVQLYAGPAGSEVTGPYLFPDDRTLFAAIQHPGEGGGTGVADPSLNPISRWPDSNKDGAPAVPRPSVVQITRTDGTKIVPTLTAKFVPMAPSRVLDTRDGTGVATPGPLDADTVIDVAIEDLDPAELSRLAGLVLNTTITEAAAPGYLTVHPSGQPRPYASALNVDAVGQTRANLVSVPVGPTGGISVYHYGGGHVLADLMGMYVFTAGSSDGRYQGLTPARLFDTRDGTGAVPVGKLAGGTPIDVQVLGRAGVPATGVSGVVLNVTVTEPDDAGYVTVWPEGTAPNASNLNHDPGEEHVAGQVLVPVGPDGSVRVLSFATAHVLADVAGWFTDETAEQSDSGLFVPITPVRVRDTRDGKGGSAGKLAAGATTTAPVLGQAGIPDEVISAVVANLTFTEAEGPGYVTAYPSGIERPYASSLNVTAKGQTIANHITIPVGADGSIALYAQVGGHVIVDVTGYYTN